MTRRRPVAEPAPQRRRVVYVADEGDGLLEGMTSGTSRLTRFSKGQVRPSIDLVQRKPSKVVETPSVHSLLVSYDGFLLVDGRGTYVPPDNEAHARVILGELQKCIDFVDQYVSSEEEIQRRSDSEHVPRRSGSEELSLLLGSHHSSDRKEHSARPSTASLSSRRSHSSSPHEAAVSLYHGLEVSPWVTTGAPRGLFCDDSPGPIDPLRASVQRSQRSSLSHPSQLPSEEPFRSHSSSGASTAQLSNRSSRTLSEEGESQEVSSIDNYQMLSPHTDEEDSTATEVPPTSTRREEPSPGLWGSIMNVGSLLLRSVAPTPKVSSLNGGRKRARSA